MPVKRYQQGTGLTKRNRVKVTGSGPNEREAVEAILQSASKSRLEAIREACTQVLERLELPTDPMVYDELEMAHKRPSMQSEAWYALECLSRIGVLDAQLERNEAHRAADMALDVGLTWQEAVFKFNWEADALRGIQYAQNAAKAREGGTRKLTLRQERMRAIAERHFGWRPGARLLEKTRKIIRHQLQTEHPEYRRLGVATLRKDELTIGLDVRQAPRRKAK